MRGSDSSTMQSDQRQCCWVSRNSCYSSICDIYFDIRKTNVHINKHNHRIFSVSLLFVLLYSYRLFAKNKGAYQSSQPYRAVLSLEMSGSGYLNLEPCLLFFVFAKARFWTLLSCVTCFMMFYSGAFFYVEGRLRHILKLRQVSCERLLITHLLRL